VVQKTVDGGANVEKPRNVEKWIKSGKTAGKREIPAIPA
jgi:hypothetical protein